MKKYLVKFMFLMILCFGCGDKDNSIGPSTGKEVYIVKTFNGLPVEEAMKSYTYYPALIAVDIWEYKASFIAFKGEIKLANVGWLSINSGFFGKYFGVDAPDSLFPVQHFTISDLIISEDIIAGYYQPGGANVDTAHVPFIAVKGVIND